MIRLLTRKRVLLAVIAAAAQPLPMTYAAETPTGAQTQPGVEELIVTARRREESLQDVPAALDVFTNQEMFYSGNDSMDDLRDVVPNFQFASDMAFRSRATLRGLGADRSGAQTNGIGFFINGVYQAGTARFNAPFFDVERVEVLRGPQGARYGRNSFAGVVNVITRKPDNEFRASVQADAGNVGTREFAGLVAGPIIKDRLYGKLALSDNRSDGDYQHNITGEDILDSDSQSYDARLIWDITDEMSLDLSYGKSFSDGVAFSFSITDGLQDLSENFLLRDDQNSGQDNEDTTLVYTWNTGELELRNLLFFRDAFTHLKVDGDVTPFDGILAVVESEGEVWGDEIRLQSTSAGPFHWLVGAEIYNSEAHADFPTSFLSEIGAALGSPVLQFLNGVVSTNTIDAEQDVWSIFGEVSYEFFDRLEATASVRYDDIESEVFNAAGGGRDGKFEDELLQPLFSLRYSLDDNTSAYVSAAKGAREGGFNSSALSKDYAIFQSDEMWSYEVGLKKEFPDSGAHLNFAAFYIDADTLNQAAIIVTDAGNLANGAITLGGARSYGIEVETGLPLTENIDWAFNMGLLDCRLQDVPPFEQRSPDFQQVAGGVMSGNECQDSSEWTFATSLNGVWAMNVGGGSWELVGTIGLSGRGETRLTTDNGFPTRAGPLDPQVPFSERTLRREEEIQEPVYLVNATLGVRSENFQILLYGDNLTDQLYALDNYHHEGLCDSGICGLGVGKFITTLAPQRRYGLKVRYDL